MNAEFYKNKAQSAVATAIAQRNCGVGWDRYIAHASIGVDGEAVTIVTAGESRTYTDHKEAADVLFEEWAKEEEAYAAQDTNFINVEDLSGSADRARKLRDDLDYRFEIVARRHGRGGMVSAIETCCGQEIPAGSMRVRF